MLKINKPKYITNKSNLEWSKEEYDDLVKRLLSLRDDQIAALAGGILVRFDTKILSKVVQDIKAKGKNSPDIDPILKEASSEEDLLWWLNFFEKYNNA